jgi:hypothetical protein
LEADFEDWMIDNDDSFDAIDDEVKPKNNLAEFFAASPLRNSEIDLERITDDPRPIELE